MRKLYLAGCTCVLLAAGCDRATTPTGAEAVPVPSVVETIPARLVEQINPSVVLKATPNPVDFCGSQELPSVTVEWDASAAAIPNLSIWVEETSGGPQKIWMSSKLPVSSKVTGAWVRDGMKFSLTDNRSVVLATTTVTAADCAVAVAVPESATHDQNN